MADRNREVTITQKELWALENKAKQGWKCYYIERDWALDWAQRRLQYMETATNLRRGEEVDIAHITRLFLEMYDKIGEKVDCPICLEQMEKNNTHLPICGHLICKTCKMHPVVNKCPICQKPY